MGRASWKNLFFSKNIWRYLKQKKNKKSYLIYNRQSTIPFYFLSKILILYQGKYKKNFKVLKYSHGFKFGEFGFTRHPFYFPHVEKKKKR